MAEYYSKSTLLSFLRYGISPNSMLSPVHIERMLDCIPTVDAEPLVHGRWMKPERSLWPMADCSVCGKMSLVADTANYCPNCGAKMDGEKNE